MWKTKIKGIFFGTDVHHCSDWIEACFNQTKFLHNGGETCVWSYFHEELFELRPQRSHTLAAGCETPRGFSFRICGKSSSNTSCSAFKPSWISAELKQQIRMLNNNIRSETFPGNIASFPFTCQAEITTGCIKKLTPEYAVQKIDIILCLLLSEKQKMFRKCTSRDASQNKLFHIKISWKQKSWANKNC